VNCGAISAELVQSELFGHGGGALGFKGRTGQFELANGGTLFLDEVGGLPPETQAKLLRVLENGEFEPVGSSQTVHVDVRLIAATNQNLEEAATAGRFRLDLFHRLNVFPIRVPALRERKADITQLVLFFLSRSSERWGRRFEGVSQDTMERLVRHSWPGNIRQLKNVIERAVLLSRGTVLEIPMAEFEQSANTADRAVLTLDAVERDRILRVLVESNWVVGGPSGAAARLGLNRTTLVNRMRELGIRLPRSS
jgi:transcriptional regulator with GAF, ATPase, and Fis domain